MMKNIDELTGAFTMFPLGSNSHKPLESLFIKAPTNFHLLPDHQNPTHDESSQLFHNLPSPFFDEHELPLNQILPKNLLMAAPDLRQDQDTATADAKRGPAATKRCGGASKSKAKDYTAVAPRRRSLGAVPRRRTGKKDRHSKISTAQGIRDRRMRLSLQVARKFFDLQDMLGYDKASKTIEWLFSKSKKAIKELTGDNLDNPLANSINSMSDTNSESDCEVVSGIDHENSNSNVDQVKEAADFPISGAPPFVVEDDKKSIKAARKSSVRESREKARARARCRTMGKQMIQGLENPSPSFNDFQTLGSSEPVTDFQAESSSINPTHYVSQADVGTIEKLLGVSPGSSTSYPIPDFYSSAAVSCCLDPASTNFMGLPGCWDLLNNFQARNHHPSSVNYTAAFDSHPNFFPLYDQ